LFTEFVVDPAAHRFRFQRKHQAIASTRRAYREHQVPPEAVNEKASVSAGPYAGTFDFAVANGRVVQLVQCWSFQLPNQAELAEQVKAWAWVVRELADQGGVLHVGEARNIEVPPRDVEVMSVFIPPQQDQDAPAFDEARAAFQETGVTQLTPDQAGVIGERAAMLLEAGLAAGR
jgi:hypothetical protein